MFVTPSPQKEKQNTMCVPHVFQQVNCFHVKTKGMYPDKDQNSSNSENKDVWKFTMRTWLAVLDSGPRWGDDLPKGLSLDVPQGFCLTFWGFTDTPTLYRG